jgi:hypothetical protein
MPGNPQIPQGTLNLTRASVQWAAYPQYNITASNLGRAGIRLALEGDATRYIENLAGATTSPQPYQMFRLTVALLKPQSLAAAYKAQYEASTLLGNGVLRPDLPPGTGLTSYQLTNASMTATPEMAMNGEEAVWQLIFRGYYLINSTLWG